MDTLGTLESIQKLTQRDLIEYYHRIVVPENMVLTVVGDVDEKQILLAAKKGLGDLERRPCLSLSIPQETSPQQIRKAEIYKMKEQAHFVLGFLGINFQHRDRYAMEVLDAALSSQGGRLFYESRDRESLAYALGFMAHPNLDLGYIGVFMGTHPISWRQLSKGC